MRFRCEPLGDQHLDDFDCGNDELTTWLQRHAKTATGQGTRTTLLIDEDRHVVAYFSIAPHLLDRDALPAKIGRGAPRQIPAILLAKLAVSSTHHGQGLGTDLLVNAIRAIISAARSAGGKLIVVDAIDNAAAAFFRHHDFDPLPNRADRLVMKLSTAARAVNEHWP